jgi:hypothetical protein
MTVIKKLISPFQKVLLNKRLCPGCTMPLDRAKKFPFDTNEEMTICQCKRMFIYDKNSDSYRRATFREAEEFSKSQ